MIQSGQILNAINLNSAFVSTSYNNQIITGIKKFSNDLYSTKLIASTSDWNKQLILTHDGTDANITTSVGNIVLKTSSAGNVVFKNSSTATEDIVFRVDSSFAGITLNADKANTSGEPGGAYILFLQDGALTKASIGLTQAIGKDSTGNTFANTLDNAFVIGTQTSNPIQIGSNNSVALTVDISNNVGIGTTSPTSKLEVNGVVKATTFTSTATSGAPFSVSSSERVLNLNADMVDGVHVDGLVLKSGDTMTGKLTINSGDSSNGIIETSNINKWIWKLSNYNVGEYWDTTNNNIELRSYYGKVRLIGGNNGTPGTAVEIDNSGKVTSSGLDFVSDNTSTIGTSSKRASGIYSKQYSAYNLNTLDNSFVSYRNTQGAISDTNNHIYTESGYDLFSGNTIYSAEAGSQIIDYVYYYNGSTYTDLTTNIEHNATNQTVLSATGHYIYVGDSSTFSRLYIQIGSSGSGVALKVEYYNGSAWTTLTTTDNTSNLTLSGWLTWTTPGNWAATTVNGQSKYWVRISTTSTPTTAPQIRGINVSLFSGNFINLYAHGYEKLRINNRGTIYSAGTIYPGTASQGTSVQTNNYISGTSTGIGINTTSPSEMLHVVGDVKIEGSGSTIGGANVDNGYIVLGTSTKMGIDNNEIMVDGDHLYIGSKTMATIFRVGTTEYARLNNDGKFGIGTTLPAELLHVAGKARVENLSLYSVSQAPVLYFNAKYNSGDKYIANGSAYQLFHDTDNNKLRFRSAASGTADAAITFNEGLVIDTSGNVGVKPTIDTTSLPYGLTVNATLGMINGNNIELKASSGSPDDAGDIIFYNNGGTQKGKIWTATDTTSQLFISGSDTTADLTVKDNEVQVRRKLSIIGDYTGGTDYYPAIHFNHNSLTDKKVLAVYGGDGNGYGMYLESGAALIIGSGESAGAAYPNLTATAEELWLTSDNGITLMTNIQSGYANRKVITIGTDGVVNFANTNMTSTDRLVFNNTSGGWTGLKFNSGVNAGSDYGYIRYYDDASTLSSNYDINSGSSENSALVIGVENEENSTSGDVLILKGGNRVIIDADTSSRASEDPSYIVDFRAEQVQKAYIDINGNVSANRFISNVATGTSPLQVASTTTVSNLSSDTVDGYHASELYNNTAIKTSTKTNLAVGWYTIAVVAGNGTNSNNRAVARFAIRDIASNRHQEVVFYATHMYGIDSSNTITVLSQASYNITPFRYIRIKENGTYDGAALQVYIDDATNIVTAYILGDNFQANGWIIKDWIADATDPGDVTGYASFTEKVRVDLDNQSQGGIITSSGIYTAKPSIFDNYVEISAPAGLISGNDAVFRSKQDTYWTELRAQGGGSANDLGLRVRYSTDSGTNWTDVLLATGNDLKYKTNKIWHEGNDGAGSGLDADLLDGLNSSAFALSGHNHDGVYAPVHTHAALTVNTNSDITSVAGATYDTTSGKTVTMFKPDQNINTASTPQFTRLGLGGTADSTYKLKISDGTILTGTVDGASAIGFTLNTPSYATTGAKLISFRNNGTEKAYIDKDGNISGNTLISTVATGSAPLTVSSTTKVTNLNADLLDGYNTDTGTTANTIPVRDGSGVLPGYCYGVWHRDTRSTDHNPFDYKGVTIHLKTNTTDGLNDGGTYHGVLHLTQWNDSSGGRVHQLAFTDNGNINFRQHTGSAWTRWQQILSVGAADNTAGKWDYGTTAPTGTTRLNYSGYLYATRVYNAVYNDYAEFFEKGEENLEPGDIISKIEGINKYGKSKKAYDKLVVGIYSDSYGHCLGGDGKDDVEERFIPIGLAGRVNVKVIGKIEEGDLITASDIPGVGMKAEQYIPGTIIGKALESYDKNEIGKISILIQNI